jgi:hypothetical protein
MSVQQPDKYSYDYDLGIEPEIIDYMKESHQIQLRVSPIHCYLLKQVLVGCNEASVISPFTITSYTETDNQYRAEIWPSGSVEHPDLRPDINNGSGSVTLNIDGVTAERIVDYNDLINDNEYSIVKRYDVSTQRVEIVFNVGFNPHFHNITYYYTYMDEDMSPERMKSNEATESSPFGYEQYFNYTTDKYVNYHQILVRMPLTIQNVVINEEGLVTLKDNNCWTIWEPYIDNFDILIVPATESPTGIELRFEIKEKQDSIIQGTLVRQIFKVKALTTTDKIYNIPYVID